MFHPVTLTSFYPKNHFLSEDGIQVTGSYTSAHGQFFLQHAVTIDTTFNLTISGMGVVKMNTFNSFDEALLWIKSGQPMYSPCQRIRGRLDKKVVSFAAKVVRDNIEFWPFKPGQVHSPGDCFTLPTGHSSTVLAFDIECGDIQVLVTNLRSSGHLHTRIFHPLHSSHIKLSSITLGSQASLTAPVPQSLCMVNGDILTPDTVLFLKINGPDRSEHKGSYFRLWISRGRGGQRSDGRNFTMASSSMFCVAPKTFQVYMILVKANQLHITHGNASKSKDIIREQFDRHRFTLWVEFYRISFSIHQACDLSWDWSDPYECALPPCPPIDVPEGSTPNAARIRPGDNHQSLDVLDFSPPPCITLPLSPKINDNRNNNNNNNGTWSPDRMQSSVSVAPGNRNNNTTNNNNNNHNHNNTWNPGCMQSPVSVSEINRNNNNNCFHNVESVNDFDPIRSQCSAFDLVQNSFFNNMAGTHTSPPPPPRPPRIPIHGFQVTPNQENDIGFPRQENYYNELLRRSQVSQDHSYLSVLSQNGEFPVAPDDYADSSTDDDCFEHFPASAPIPCSKKSEKPIREATSQPSTFKNIKNKISTSLGLKKSPKNSSGQSECVASAFIKAASAEFCNQGFFDSDLDHSPSPEDEFSIFRAVHGHKSANGKRGRRGSCSSNKSNNNSPRLVFGTDTIRGRSSTSSSDSDQFLQFNFENYRDSSVSKRGEDINTAANNQLTTFKPESDDNVIIGNIQNLSPTNSSSSSKILHLNNNSFILNDKGVDNNDDNNFHRNQRPNNNNNNNRSSISSSSRDDGCLQRGQRASSNSTAKDSGYDVEIEERLYDSCNNGSNDGTRRYRISSFKSDESYHQTIPKRLV